MGKGKGAWVPFAQAFEPVGNAFCPTGEGGGQDNSCPPGGGGGGGGRAGKTLDEADARPGDRVRMALGVGSKLEGKVVKVVEGPKKVSGVRGVYVVRSEDGHEEEIHGSRLTHA